MNIGLACAIFKNLEGNERSDEEKMKAIALVAEMETKNGVPKTDCIKAIKYLLSKVETWTPIKFRPLTEEERERLSDESDLINEIDSVFDCGLPDEGEEVLITFKDGSVGTDIFCKDGNYCYFDNYDTSSIIAWRHKPEGYKEEVRE